VVVEGDMLRKSVEESSEPVVGRLGICKICTAKASGISRETVKSGCAREWGGWGQISGGRSLAGTSPAPETDAKGTPLDAFVRLKMDSAS